MAETTKIAEITVVVDDDTGMYRIGEVDGGFINQEALKHHIKKYGKEGLVNQLTYMQWSVWSTFMELNRENEQTGYCSNAT